MTAFCCDISGLDDKTLAFFGYRLEDENDEFKIYRDKYGEPHLVSKKAPLLYVEDVNDAAYINAKRVIVLPDD